MKIQSVIYDHGYQLQIEFDDGKLIDADFNEFLLSARNPMTTQFKDKKLFAKVKLWHGITDWFGEMDFDPLDIYYDRIPGVKIRQIHSV